MSISVSIGQVLQGVGDWLTITGKPTEFPPEAHGHAQSEVTNLTTDLAAKVPTTRTINSQALSSNITLTQDDVGDGTTNKVYTATEKTKLSGIATAATANDTDANLKARANHTGFQAISTITSLQTTLDAKAALSHTHAQSEVTNLTTDLAAKVPTTRTVNGQALSANVTLTADSIDDTSTAHKFATAAELTKLGGIAASATANAADATLLARANHTGTQSADTLTDGTTNKAFLATERTKLSGIATSATANSSDATLLARANHTGTQSADTLTDGSTNRLYSTAEKAKLLSVGTGATANDTDANLKARANHTGTQSADTIIDGTTNKAYTATEKTKLAGIASGANVGLTDVVQDTTPQLGGNLSLNGFGITDPTGVYGLTHVAAHIFNLEGSLVLDGMSTASFASSLDGTFAGKSSLYLKGFINHGATAGTLRPANYASVEWYGSVEPTNAINGDTWINTA